MCSTVLSKRGVVVENGVIGKGHRCQIRVGGFPLDEMSQNFFQIALEKNSEQRMGGDFSHGTMVTKNYQ